MNSIPDPTIIQDAAGDYNLVQFDLIEPDDYWDEACPLFEEALHGSDDTAEHIYHLLKARQATMLCTESMFVVVQFVKSEGDVFDMLVWVAASRGPTNCIRTHLKALEQLAFAEGARYIAFKTNRTGFSRVMPQDWCIMQATWGKRLH